MQKKTTKKSAVKGKKSRSLSPGGLLGSKTTGSKSKKNLNTGSNGTVEGNISLEAETKKNSKRNTKKKRKSA